MFESVIFFTATDSGRFADTAVLPWQILGPACYKGRTVPGLVLNALHDK